MGNLVRKGHKGDASYHTHLISGKALERRLQISASPWLASEVRILGHRMGVQHVHLHAASHSNKGASMTQGHRCTAWRIAARSEQLQTEQEQSELEPMAAQARIGIA